MHRNKRNVFTISFNQKRNNLQVTISLSPYEISKSVDQTCLEISCPKMELLFFASWLAITSHQFARS